MLDPLASSPLIPKQTTFNHCLVGFQKSLYWGNQTTRQIKHGTEYIECQCIDRPQVKTIQKLTTTNYEEDFQFNVGDYDAAIGHFVKRGFSRVAAESTAYIILQQAKIDNVSSQEILDILKLSHLADEYAGNLSTGQKKLLEIGRTLMSDPKIILLDEPAAGVNPTLMNNIVDRIIAISKERKITFLIIEHNMDLIMNLCNPIIVMSYGSKLAEGNAKSIRNNKSVIDAYLGN